VRSPIRASLAVALVLAPLLLSSASFGQGYEEPTRKQWVREADNVCEKPYQRGNRLVDRFAKRADRERWVPAGRILVRLSKLILGVVERVGELDRPPADEEAILKWLDAEERGAELFKEAGRKLKREKVRRAAKLLDRSDRIVTKGQKAVKGFGLRECV
jgi:hypothetical protein